MPPQPDPAVARRKAHGALATASRVRILDLLRSTSTPLDVPQIATQTGLHPNTVRFHLRVLVDAGLACCRPDARGASGRPRLLYTPATEVSGNRHPDGFQLLAGILAGFLAANNEIPPGLAEEAGRAFARRRRGSAETFTRVSADDAVRRLVAMLAELGFEPELVRDGSYRRILLHACPFHPVAKEHPEVVCAMHLGLLKQTLADFGAAVDVTGLEPFIAPHLCVAHLADGGHRPAEPTPAPS